MTDKRYQRAGVARKKSFDRLRTSGTFCGLAVATACGLFAAASAMAAQPAAQSASQLIGCIIEPDEVVEVGSPVIGVIQSIVKRGDRVRKGQVLVVLRNDIDRAALSVAQSRAAADAEEKAAVANYEFSRQRRVRAEELVRKEFVAKQALDQAIAEDEVAKQKLSQAREQERRTRNNKRPYSSESSSTNCQNRYNAEILVASNAAMNGASNGTKYEQEHDFDREEGGHFAPDHAAAARRSGFCDGTAKPLGILNDYRSCRDHHHSYGSYLHR